MMRKYTIYRNNLIDFSDKAIKVYIERNDGVRIPNPVVFPKSQINYTLRGMYYTVEIPEWLVNKNIGRGFRIIEW